MALNRNFSQCMSQTVQIANKRVGQGESCYLIAEIGLNHNGDPVIAKRLIDIASAAGVDAVKFQKRTTRDILIRAALDKPYESENAFGPTYGAHRDFLEFSREVYEDLIGYARAKDVHFFASVWDPKSADCMEELGVPAFKIASADLTNLPLLAHVAKKKKPLIVSTGMSTMEEIDHAVEAILRFSRDLILMHCISTYPCEDSDANLQMINVLQRRFGVPVGYSGHDRGVLIPALAVALGAHAVEKHITLDRAMKGSDQSASLEPEGLRRFVRNVRIAESALGDGVKRVLDSEIPLRHKLAKSVATSSFIPRGTVITERMLTIKGPGNGIKPVFLQRLAGKIAQTPLEEDTLVPLDALEWPGAHV